VVCLPISTVQVGDGKVVKVFGTVSEDSRCRWSLVFCSLRFGASLGEAMMFFATRSSQKFQMMFRARIFQKFKMHEDILTMKHSK